MGLPMFLRREAAAPRPGKFVLRLGSGPRYFMIIICLKVDSALMARLLAGAEIIFESDSYPAAILRAAELPRLSLSECTALAKTMKKEGGKLRFSMPNSPPMLKRLSVIASPGIRA